MKKPHAPAPAGGVTIPLPEGGEAVEFAPTTVVFEIPEPLGELKHYVVTVGYRLHDHTQGAYITHKPSPAHENAWIREQLAAGLIKEVPAPAGE